VLELGGNKLEGSKEVFDTQYKNAIADWLF
jgi:hypothetical protein